MTVLVAGFGGFAVCASLGMTMQWQGLDGFVGLRAAADI
jgi:hypothetical protein